MRSRKVISPRSSSRISEEVKALELAEHFGCEDIVHGVDFAAAARNVHGNEHAELLHDTVTERNAELFDYVKVERGNRVEHFLLTG